MKTFWRHHGLSLVLLGLFLVCWAGQAVAGWKTFNGERQRDGREGVPFVTYLGGHHFWQATGENWESEFLQMAAYVVLTCFLFQKGSAESKDPDAPPDEAPATGSFLYRNSLSIALLILFLGSFLLHAEAGWRLANDERAGGPPMTRLEWLGNAEFWFQSFQNWQSEFLAVLAIVVLSIFLRQHGSPESKKLDAPHSRTGR